MVQKINDLPTLPTMMMTITRLMQDPRTSADELGRAIGTDPSLVSKVLKLVNSAFYGFPGRISTITQAIVILGFSTIRNVVLTTSVLKLFGRDSRLKGFDVETFWEHSLLTGAIAKALAVEKDAPFTEETFIAGLLHDMGHMILSQKLTAEFEKVLAHQQKQGGSLMAAEQAVLGLNHGEIGAWLAKKWNLPEPFVVTMRHHHHPDTHEAREMRKTEVGSLIGLVHAANVMSQRLGPEGQVTPESAADIHPEIWAELSVDDWERFQSRTKDEIDKARAFLDIL